MVTDSTDGILSAVSDVASPATFCWSVESSTPPSVALTTMVPVAPDTEGKY